MTLDIVIAVFLLGTGLVTLAARIFGWKALLSKREPMQQHFGERRGDIVHLMFYTVLPLTVGGYFLLRLGGYL